ncbi:MAG TPA: flagellar assembly protein FliH [Steroidobacteraceae bacterium]|nr:flagellar assembly protein FliH [Steroidobacteraceae bacterium]
MSEPAVTAWELPEISGPVVNRRSKFSVAELDAIGQQAWEEGFAKGLEAGQVAAQQQQKPVQLALQHRAQRLQAVLDFLAAPLAELDEAVEAQLAALACSIARHVVRRELRIDPSQVVATVRETVGLLPIAARDVRVHLHPDDAAILRERLAEPQSRRAWTIVEDPVLERGGCRVVTEDSQVDARVETLIGSVIANVMGDQRAPAGATRDTPQ